MSDMVMSDPEQAHLWVVDPHELGRIGYLSSYLGILSPDERDRMQRLYFERDRLAFLAAHGLARTALSSCVPSVPPEVWAFRHTEYGRPEVASPRVRPVLRFNISHTHRLVACLVTVQIDCGIDVEMLDRAIDVSRLSTKVLSPVEYARLQAVPAHAQHELFFEYWTLKEAYAKARGFGISIPLDKCTFEFHPGGIRARFDFSLNDNATDWQFEQWSPTENHFVAAALRGGRVTTHQIVRHHLPPAFT
jgi:4'-phosphopantetheinyl transferase